MNHVKDVHNMCRLCFSTSSLVSVFDYRLKRKGNMREIVEVTTGVKISPEDKISHMLCSKCSHLTIRMFKFRNASIINDIELKEKAYIEKTMHKSVKNLLKRNPKLKIPPSVYKCDISPIVTIDEMVTGNLEIGKKRKKTEFQKRMMVDDELFDPKARKKFKAIEEPVPQWENTTIQPPPRWFADEMTTSSFRDSFKMDQQQHRELPLLTIKAVTKSYICDVCSAVSYTKKEYKKHKVTHMLCTLCNTSFRSVEETKKHKSYCSIKNILDSQPKVLIKRCDQIKEIREEYSNAFRLLSLKQSPHHIPEQIYEAIEDTHEDKKPLDEEGSGTPYEYLEDTFKLEEFEEMPLPVKLDWYCRSGRMKEDDSDNIFKPNTNGNTTESRLTGNIYRKSIDYEDTGTFDSEKTDPVNIELINSSVKIPDPNRTFEKQQKFHVGNLKEIEKSSRTSEQEKSDKNPKTEKSTVRIHSISCLVGNVRRKSKSDESFSSEKTYSKHIETIETRVKSSNFEGHNETSGKKIKCYTDKSEQNKKLIPGQSGDKTKPEKSKVQHSDKKTIDSSSHQRKSLIRKIPLGRKSKHERLRVTIPLERINLKAVLRKNEKNSNQQSHQDGCSTGSILDECGISTNPKILYVDEASEKSSSKYHAGESNKENVIEKNKSEIFKGKSHSNESEPEVIKKSHGENCKVATETGKRAISLLHNSDIMLDHEKQVTNNSKTCDEPTSPNEGRSSSTCEQVSNTKILIKNIKKLGTPAKSTKTNKSKKGKKVSHSKRPNELKTGCATRKIYPKQKPNEKKSLTDNSFIPDIIFVGENNIEVDDIDDENAYLETLLEKIKKSKGQAKQAVQTCSPSNSDILNLKRKNKSYDLKNLEGYLSFSQIPVIISYAETPSVKYTSLKRNREQLKNSTSKNLIVSSGNKNHLLAFLRRKQAIEESKSEQIIKVVEGDSLNDPKMPCSIGSAIRIERVPSVTGNATDLNENLPNLQCTVENMGGSLPNTKSSQTIDKGENSLTSKNVSIPPIPSQSKDIAMNVQHPEQPSAVPNTCSTITANFLAENISTNCTIEMSKPSLSNTTIPLVSYATNNMTENNTVSSQTQFYVVKNSNQGRHVTVITSTSGLPNTTQAYCSTNVLSFENGNMPSIVSSADSLYTPKVSSTPNNNQVFEVLSGANIPITVSSTSLSSSTVLPSTTQTFGNTYVLPQGIDNTPMNIPLATLPYITEIPSTPVLSSSTTLNNINLPYSNGITHLNFPTSMVLSTGVTTQIFSNPEVLVHGNINTLVNISLENLPFISEISSAPVLSSSTEVSQGIINTAAKILPKPSMPELSSTPVLTSTVEVFSNTKVLPRGNVDSPENVPLAELPHKPKLSTPVLPSSTKAFSNTEVLSRGNINTAAKILPKPSIPDLSSTPVLPSTTEVFTNTKVLPRGNVDTPANAPSAKLPHKPKLSTPVLPSSTKAFSNTEVLSRGIINTAAKILPKRYIPELSSTPVLPSTTEVFPNTKVLSQGNINTAAEILPKPSIPELSSTPVLPSTTEVFSNTKVLPRGNVGISANVPLAKTPRKPKLSTPVLPSSTKVFSNTEVLSQGIINTAAKILPKLYIPELSSTPVLPSTTEVYPNTKVLPPENVATPLPRTPHKPKLSTPVPSSSTQVVLNSIPSPHENGDDQLNECLANFTCTPGVPSSSVRSNITQEFCTTIVSKHEKDNTHSNLPSTNFRHTPKKSPTPVSSSTTQSFSTSKHLSQRNDKTSLNVQGVNLPLRPKVPLTEVPSSNIQASSSNNEVSVSESSPNHNSTPGVSSTRRLPPPMRRLPPPMHLIPPPSMRLIPPLPMRLIPTAQSSVRVTPPAKVQAQTSLLDGPSVPQYHRSHKIPDNSTVMQNVVVPQAPASNQMNSILSKSRYVQQQTISQNTKNIYDQFEFNNVTYDTSIQNDLNKEGVSATSIDKYIRVKTLTELM